MEGLQDRRIPGLLSFARIRAGPPLRRRPIGCPARARCRSVSPTAWLTGEVRTDMSEFTEHRRERIILIVVAVGLVAALVGLYLWLDSPDQSGTEAGEPAVDQAATPEADSSAPSDPEFSQDEVDVLDLLPTDEPDLQDAAAVAHEFTSIFFDPGLDESDRLDQLSELATDAHVENIENRADHLDELDEPIEAAPDAEPPVVELTEIASLTESNLALLVEAQDNPYEVLLTREQGNWRVHHLAHPGEQP